MHNSMAVDTGGCQGRDGVPIAARFPNPAKEQAGSVPDPCLYFTPRTQALTVEVCMYNKSSRLTT